MERGAEFYGTAMPPGGRHRKLLQLLERPTLRILLIFAPIPLAVYFERINTRGFHRVALQRR